VCRPDLTYMLCSQATKREQAGIADRMKYGESCGTNTLPSPSKHILSKYGQSFSAVEHRLV
jgi:hypothetical protein